MVIYRDGESCEVDEYELKNFIYSLYAVDGVFETARIKNGRPEYLEAHLSRLKDGARVINAEIPGEQCESRLREFISENFTPNKCGRLRIIVFNGDDDKPHLCFTAEQYIPPGKKNYSSGVNLISAKHPFCESVLSRIKTTRRRAYSSLRELSAEKGFYDCLLTDKYGIITETTTGNVFFVEDGRVCFPPENSDRLRGVMERVVLEKLEKRGVKTGEKEFRSKNICPSTGMFITNSLIGLMPVKNINRTLLRDVTKISEIAVLLDEVSPHAPSSSGLRR